MRREIAGLLLSLVLVLLQGCVTSGGGSGASLATPSRAAFAPTDEAGFTARVAREIGRALGDAGAVRVEGPLTLKVSAAPGRAEAQMNLDRVWDYCVRVPAGCEAATAEFVAGQPALVQTDDGVVDRASVRAVVRTAGDIDGARRSRRELLGVPGKEFVAVPLGGELWLVCVADTPRATRWLDTDDLARLGSSEAGVVALGKRNLTAALPPLPGVPDLLSPDGIGHLDGDPYYESSRLALHEGWPALARRMAGRLLVAAPHSGLIVYGDGGRPGVVEAMRLVARRAAAEAQRPISTELLEWTPEGWRPLATEAPGGAGRPTSGAA